MKEQFDSAMGYTRGGRETPARAASVIKLWLYNKRCFLRIFEYRNPTGGTKSRDREVLMERAKAYPKPATAERKQKKELKKDKRNYGKP